mmetsp:Transcript_33482/g.72278  ORF Transcript_33482/g.72278 Transcript_33482/m.72278 type:complete len:139 (-) Transcript_33482:1054-1470(-)
MLPEQLEPFSHIDTPKEEDDDGAEEVHSPQPTDCPRVRHPHFAQWWINKLIDGAAAEYFTAISEIPLLSPHGCKQLATDIGYLRNVTQALCPTPSQRLEQLLTLVQATPENYLQVAQTCTALDPSHINGLARARRIQA